MLKSILYSLPIYLLLVLNLLKGKGKSIQKVFKDFLWTKNISSKNKIPLVAWKSICDPKSMGGAGIRDISLQTNPLEQNWYGKFIINLMQDCVK